MSLAIATSKCNSIAIALPEILVQYLMLVQYLAMTDLVALDRAVNPTGTRLFNLAGCGSEGRMSARVASDLRCGWSSQGVLRKHRCALDTKGALF